MCRKIFTKWSVITSSTLLLLALLLPLTYQAFGKPLIADAYDKRSLPLINEIIESRESNSLDDYYRRAKEKISDLVILLIVLSICPYTSHLIKKLKGNTALYKVCYVGVVAMLALILWKAGTFYTWDMITYVGVANSYSARDQTEIHARTYSEVRESVSTERYDELIGKAGRTRHDTYRATLADNAESFNQQLPFYSVKPAYPALMYVLQRFGVGLVDGSVFIARLAYCLIGILLYFWFALYLKPFASFAATSIMMALPFVVMQAQNSTPDSLSIFLVLSCFFLLTETGSIRAALLLAVVSILVRPDNMLIAVLIAGYAGLRYRDLRVWAALTALASLAVYILTSRLTENYGWSTLFYHTFVELLTEPAAFSSSLSVWEYIKIYLLNAHPSQLEKSSYSFLLFLLLGALAVTMRHKEAGAGDSWFQLLVVCLISMGAHWAALPNQKDRFLVGPYLFILCALIVTVAASAPYWTRAESNKSKKAEIASGAER